MTPSPLERLQARVARAVLRLPAPLGRALAGSPIVRDERELDLQVQLALVASRAAGRPALHALDVEGARRELELSSSVLAPPPRALDRVEERALEGPAGRIPVRVYRPFGAPRPAPALVYFHGGGWTLGSLDSHDPVCRALADDAGCVVVAVDYRLAPEHRFPAAADDALAATRAVLRQAAELGFDPGRVAVGGDSAGGNLAAVVSLDLRGEALRPCFQLLVYPGVDLTCSFPSVHTVGTGFFLEQASLAWFIGHYLASPEQARDPRASPWFAPDLTGAPPALVVTAGFDPLRDEGDAYAWRLAEAGVAVELQSYPTLLHGFLATTGAVDAARAAYEALARALRDALHVPAGRPEGA